MLCDYGPTILSVEEHDDDNSSAGKHEDGAEPLDDDLEWAGLPAHEKESSSRRA